MSGGHGRWHCVLAAIALVLSCQLRAQSHGEHADHAPQSHDHAHHAQESMRDEPTPSERAHVPPDPPANPLPHMSEERMIELMQMEDNAALGMVLLDNFEWREGEHEHSQNWDLQAFYGTDYNKLWLKSEGASMDGHESGRVEAAWDRIISTWWSLQTGVRHDFGGASSRTWVALGIHGLAPYFVEIDAALYVAEEGRTALRLEAEYDVLITQRWILQPSFELAAYGKDDVENGIASGISDVELGLRLRYEIRREIAPYIGVQWERLFGGTADSARSAGADADELLLVVGLRAWF